MADHHEPFRALAPVDWKQVTSHDPLAGFLSATFADAQILVDSIPPPPSQPPRPIRQPVRPRSHTESSIAQRPPTAPSPHSGRLQKEWKEIKVNARENPLDISVYKLASRDGSGSWFARRSVHDGLNFERWRLGLEREFSESLKVVGKPGGGNIRGIGAEKRVEMEVVEGVGRLEVYQLSAQFPGPTTPRDFVTLLLTSDSAPGGKGLRQFMVVSKPCIHPKCPNRNGFIRGQYESVEVVREVAIQKPVKRARSSVDLRSTEEIGGSKRIPGEDDETQVVIEWLMVTRSDPGGSVPRFMVEKGTPSGIVNDAGRFLKWVSKREPKAFASEDTNNGSKSKEEAFEVDKAIERKPDEARPVSSQRLTTVDSVEEESDDDDYNPQNPGGFYSMIASAIGAASTVVTSRLPNPFAGAQLPEHTDESDHDVLSPTHSDHDDTSSVNTFASAVEPSSVESPDDYPAAPSVPATTTPPPSVLSRDSSLSTTSKHTTTTSTPLARQEKDLRKLDLRRLKLEDKLSRLQTRSAERDVQAREKAEIESKKLEAKYQRELSRLAEKRAAEERKVKERTKKLEEKEEKKRASVEIEKVRAERDMARKQIDMLKAQVGELQAQNTRLVAKLGRMGVDVQGQEL